MLDSSVWHCIQTKDKESMPDMARTPVHLAFFSSRQLFLLGDILTTLIIKRTLETTLIPMETRWPQFGLAWKPEHHLLNKNYWCAAVLAEKTDFLVLYFYTYFSAVYTLKLHKLFCKVLLIGTHVVMFIVHWYMHECDMSDLKSANVNTL